MTASKTPFVIDTDGQGNNTRIDYHFASQGKTVKGSVVIEGVFAEEDFPALKSYLEDGVDFDPQRLGIPDLFMKMPSSWNGDDYLHTIERISQTNRDFDDAASSASQIAALIDVATNPTTWNTEAGASFGL